LGRGELYPLFGGRAIRTPKSGHLRPHSPEETLMFKYLILPFVLALTACTGEKSEDSSKDSAAQAE